MTHATAIAPSDAGHVQREQHQALQVEDADTFAAGMNAPMTSAYTGRRAEHVISGAIMIVARRSRVLEWCASP